MTANTIKTTVKSNWWKNWVANSFCSIKCKVLWPKKEGIEVEKDWKFWSLLKTRKKFRRLKTHLIYFSQVLNNSNNNSSNKTITTTTQRFKWWQWRPVLESHTDSLGDYSTLLRERVPGWQMWRKKWRSRNLTINYRNSTSFSVSKMESLISWLTKACTDKT